MDIGQIYKLSLGICAKCKTWTYTYVCISPNNCTFIQMSIYKRQIHVFNAQGNFSKAQVESYSY